MFVENIEEIKKIMGKGNRDCKIYIKVNMYRRKNQQKMECIIEIIA